MLTVESRRFGGLTFVSLPSLLRRSERPLCHRGALSSPPLPRGQESAHAGQAEDAAPRLRRALLLVSPASSCPRPDLARPLIAAPVSRSHVSPEHYRHRFACLTFTVMDYDWLSTNDFAGEAVAPLSDFCWPGRPNASPAGKSVQPVILHLSRSKPSGAYAQPRPRPQGIRLLVSACVCSRLQRSQSCGCWTPASGTGRLRSSSAG